MKCNFDNSWTTLCRGSVNLVQHLSGCLSNLWHLFDPMHSSWTCLSNTNIYNITCFTIYSSNKKIVQGSNFDTRPFWKEIPVSIFGALLYHDSSYLIGFKPRQNTSTFSNLVTQFDINNGRFNAAPYRGTYSRQCNQLIPTRTLDLIPKKQSKFVPPFIFIFF